MYNSHPHRRVLRAPTSGRLRAAHATHAGREGAVGAGRGLPHSPHGPSHHPTPARNVRLSWDGGRPTSPETRRGAGAKGKPRPGQGRDSGRQQPGTPRVMAHRAAAEWYHGAPSRNGRYTPAVPDRPFLTHRLNGNAWWGG